MEILELLGESGLFTGEELSAMEGYLRGDLGEEAPEGFRYRDLGPMPHASRIREQFEEMVAGGKNRQAGRLGRLFFALGQASAYALYPMDVFSDEIEGLWKEPSEKAAVFAMEMAKDRRFMDKEAFGALIQMADKEPKNLIRAMEYKGEDPDSVCVLLTAYFAMRYPRGQGMDPKIPGGMGKLFVHGASGSQVMEQDEPLLERYERFLLELLQTIYDDNIPEDKIRQIVSAAERDEMDRSVLKLSYVPWGRVNRKRISFLSKCAYINHALSPVIRNVMSVCLSAQMEMVLECMEQVDIYGEVVSKGGNFDLIFGVDSLKLVKWAARQGKDEILRTQFGRKPERFMFCMEGMDYRTYNTMSQIVEEMSAGRYRKWLGGELYRSQLKLVECFGTSIGKRTRALGAELEEDVKAYLCQEKDVRVVYDVKEALRDVWFWGSQELWELKRYQQKYGYDALSERCETLLSVGHGISIGHILSRGNGVKDNAKETLERLFSGMESQGVDLNHRLDTYCYLYENAGLEEWEELLRKVGEEKFGEYLRHGRKEMLEVFRGAGSTGRKLGLEVMAKEALENREEIFKYVQDASKGVREALIGILYTRKDWEEGIAGLLLAKKATVREVGIKVYARWLEETLNTGEALSAEEALNAEEAGDEEGSNSTAQITQESKAVLRGKYVDVLTQALEKEKNAKNRELLDKILRNGREVSGRSIGEEALVQEIHKGNRKRALAWAYGTPFSKVHRKDGKEAEEVYLQAILLCYYMMGIEGVWQEWFYSGSISDNGSIWAKCDLVSGEKENSEKKTRDVSPSASFLAEALDRQEFEIYVGEFFDRWVEAGADARKRWVLYAAAVHGGEGMVGKLYRLIQEWAKEARGAMAAEAVMALVLSPEKQALATVDKIAWKFKYRQVQKAAWRAVDYAAKGIGITREELEDRLIPDFGFGHRARRIFDYGARKFTVAITAGFEIEVFEEGGRKLKSLPKPGKQEEGTKAEAAFEEFRDLKKLLKDMGAVQKKRMERAFLTGRRWTVEMWKKLFIENPIMRQFAVGLVWGIYTNGKLTQCYRYMEDGSYNTEEGEEFVFPRQSDVQSPAGDVEQGADAEAKADQRQIGQGQGAFRGQEVGRGQVIGQDQLVGLVHPIELSEASLDAWKEQLADYEITQPIAQLNRPIYHRTEEENNQTDLTRFVGMAVKQPAFHGRLISMGWEKGKGKGAGGYDYYFREDRELSIKTVLRFRESDGDDKFGSKTSKLLIGGSTTSTACGMQGDKNDTVTIYEVNFYRMDHLDGGNSAPQAKEMAYLLKEAPERYFSEIVLQVSQAVAYNREDDGNRE